jgi:glycosyltransferase involved in cell wall biosynthesis
MADARAAGIAEIVTTTGFVAEDELPAYLKACDIISCLRFPTARETSASWLRALAAGRPTLVTDLAQQVEVPTLDPQSWTVLRAGPSADPASAVAVNIPPLDEMHALTVALKRLVTDAPLRDALGARALEFWRARHTVAAMVRDWERVLSAAATKPAPAVSLPPHLRPDGLEHARRIATSLGIALPDELA